MAIDAGLRQKTLAAIDAVRALLAAGITPLPRADSHCRACSLHDRCQPQAVKDASSREDALSRLFDPEE